MAYSMRTMAAPAIPGQTTPAIPSQPAPASGGLLSLQDFEYIPTEGLTGDQGAFVSDYYSQMANNYLPQVDQFAIDNAGQMVAWDSDKFMTVNDFGLDSGRGNLRGGIETGYYLGDQWYAGSPDQYFAGGKNGNYQSLAPTENDGNGIYSPGGYAGPADGTELFTATARPSSATGVQQLGQDATTEYDYTSAGTYRKETEEEAWARMVAQGGAHSDSEFGGSQDLEYMTKDERSNNKWGSDLVNMPELAQYINDPNWVTRGDDGKVTAMRAELLPLVFRQELGEQFSEVMRGSTKESDVAFQIVSAIVIGVVTMGVGTAAAAGMGMVGAAGGAVGGMTGALTGGAGLTTLGSVVAGGISGGVGAAIQGGDIGKGVLTGGIGGGVGRVVSNGIAGTGVEWLDNGTIANNALTKGTVGSLTTAARGGDGAAIGTSFLANAGSSAIMETMAYNNLTTGSTVIDGVVGNLLTQTIGGAINPADDPLITTRTTTPTEETPEEDAPATPATPDTTTVPAYSGGRINYVKR